MDAFIVRPFGTKNGVDFEEVQEKLIEPALAKAGISGSTTAAVVRAGNIRLDMFQLLLTSDLVIADISIHNANVFYELGIRHALRPGKTFMIRCQGDEVPFDLKTDRYFAYNPEKPDASVDDLARGISATIRSEETDSPVFLMLPGLRAHSTADFIAVPAGFTAEAELASRTRNRGKLRLLSEECRSFFWSLPALWNLGLAQFGLGYFDDARESMERLIRMKPKETRPYEILATIYQRLAEKELMTNPPLADELFAKSEMAINTLFARVGGHEEGSLGERYALKARNEKWRWVRSWADAADAERQTAAAGSALLTGAYESYHKAYFEDLNEYYAAINALGLLKILIELALRVPDLWSTSFDSDEQAGQALEGYRKEFGILEIMLGKTLAVKEGKLKAMGKTDIWLELTKAEFTLLTSENPERVRRLYQHALEKGVKEMKDFNISASKRQVSLYAKLGIMPFSVAGVLEVFRKFEAMPPQPDLHVLLFTGHMIDAPDRRNPRFPQEREAAVSAKIRSAVEAILKSEQEKAPKGADKPHGITAIAGGACGGDIIFHEVCRELGIASGMYLALPPDKYVARSVSFAGKAWVDRFYKLLNDPAIPHYILADTEEMPSWLEEQVAYSFWERNNLWLLNTALSKATGDLTFLALWDGKEGDGPGGTRHMISVLEKKGARSIVLKP